MSTSPRVGSVIDVLVDYNIKTRSKAARIDAGCSRGCFSQSRPGYEWARPNGPKLRHRRAVTRDDDRPTSLHFSKDGCGLIAKLPPSDDSIHWQAVAYVALCSKRLVTEFESRFAMLGARAAISMFSKGYLQTFP